MFPVFEKYLRNQQLLAQYIHIPQSIGYVLDAWEATHCPNTVTRYQNIDKYNTPNSNNRIKY